MKAHKFIEHLFSESFEREAKLGLPQVNKWSGKNKNFQGQGKVREFYFESGKINILSQENGI